MPRTRNKTQANRPHKYSEVLTVMMMDLCGYTKLSSKLKREALERVQDIFDALSIEEIQRHHGRVIKKIGDAFLVTFKSPTNALICAMKVQENFRRFNRENRIRNPLKVKIGLHMGEVIVKDHDVYGDAVNIASRVESIAKPGQIYLTRSAFLAMNQNEVDTVYLGATRFKGVKNPVKIFRVKYHFEDGINRKKQVKKIITDTTLIVLFIALVYFILKYFVL